MTACNSNPGFSRLYVFCLQSRARSLLCFANEAVFTAKSHILLRSIPAEGIALNFCPFRTELELDTDMPDGFGVSNPGQPQRGTNGVGYFLVFAGLAAILLTLLAQ